MNNDIPDKNTILFTQLILMFQASAMQYLGKIGDHITGEIKRDLDQVSITIDMLDMLQAKCKGNLTADEEKLLAHIVSELKLNYIDEKKRPESTKTSDNPEPNENEPQQESN